MQNWLEENCVSFIDHVNGPLTDDGTAFRYFTLATWRAASELNAGGFTRKHGPKDSLITSYGLIQFADVRGSWCFEELQNGFGALKKTWALPSTTSGQRWKNKQTDAYNDSWETAKALSEADYLSKPEPDPSYGGSLFFAVVTVGLFLDPLPSNPAYVATIGGVQPEITIVGTPNFIKRSGKIYTIVTTFKTSAYVTEMIFDDNGLNEIQEGKMSLCGIINLTDASDMVSDFYGFPFNQIPVWCNQPTSLAGTTHGNTRGFSNYNTDDPHSDITEANCGAEITWDFTNA